MATCINHHFLNDEFWIITTGDELPMLPQECMFTYLSLNVLYGLSHLIQNGSLKNDIFDDVHLCTHFLVNTLIADETGTTTREELLRILAEKQNAGNTHIFLTFLVGCDKAVVLSQVFKWRLPVTYQFCIFGNGIHIDVINSCTIYSRIFVETLPFIIHQLHPFVKCQLAALIAYSHICFICLIGVKKLTCRNIHYQNTVRIAIIINAIHISTSDRN